MIKLALNIRICEIHNAFSFMNSSEKREILHFSNLRLMLTLPIYGIK